METGDLCCATQLARQGALTGGDIIRTRIDSVRTVNTKASFRDLVTDVDVEVEERLREFFAAETPSYGWLGEEGTFAGEPVKGAKERWIIDPIDGTTNFANGVPLCCISIALYQGDSPLLGVVYDPFRVELFEARLGAGATLNGRKLQVQDTTDLARALLATGFPDAGGGPTEALEFMRAVMPSVGKVRALGSAALELAYVAAGRLTGFWQFHLSPWDTAAGVILVNEAGGTVSDVVGGPYSLDSLSVLATNGRLHGDIVALLSR